MQTRMLILWPNGETETTDVTVDDSEIGRMASLMRLVEPFTGPMHHVDVFYDFDGDGDVRDRDMFVNNQGIRLTDEAILARTAHLMNAAAALMEHSAKDVRAAVPDEAWQRLIVAVKALTAWCDDKSKINTSLPLNPDATAIFRNVFVHKRSFHNPDDMPAVFGPAVLVDAKVWS